MFIISGSRTQEIWRMGRGFLPVTRHHLQMPLSEQVGVKSQHLLLFQ